MTQSVTSIGNPSPPLQQTPDVSVVMAVYNNAPFLSEAIQSILGQTLSNFEFLIVDDGSTDGSGEIVNRFAQQDSRIRVIRTVHQGVSAARNAAVALIRAPLVAIMDADDVSMPERFARQVEFLSAHPDHVAVGSEAMMIDPAGQQIGLKGHPPTHEQIDERLMRVNEAMTHPAVMIRTEAMRTIGGYRGTDEPARDYDLFLRLAEIGQLANLPQVLFRYRLHPDSISVGRMDAQIRSAFAAAVDAHKRRNRPLPADLNERSNEFITTTVVEGHIWRARLLTGYDGGALSHKLLDIADGYAYRHGGSRELRSRIWLERSALYRTQGLSVKRLMAWAKAVALWPRMLAQHARKVLRGPSSSGKTRSQPHSASA